MSTPEASCLQAPGRPAEAPAPGGRVAARWPDGLRPSGPVVRAAELGVWDEPGRALDAALREAEAVLSQAREQAAAERRRGYLDGRARGAEDAARLMAEATARADAFVSDLEAALPALVVEAVETILGAFEPGELLPRCVTHALGRLRHGARAELRVPPGEVARVRDALAAGSAAGPWLRVDPDPTLAPGACVFTSEYGVVELGVQAQLRALRARLAPAPAEA